VIGSWASFSCRQKIIPQSPDFVAYGWELVRDGLYAEALPQFREGVALDPSNADAHNGMGWCYGKLHVADSSALHYTDGIGLGDTSIVRIELRAGRSFAYLALGEYDSVVVDARQVVQLVPNWIFRRDSSITVSNVIVTGAAGFYATGRFDSSLVWVQRLEPTFSVDVSTLPGQAELAAKLEELAGDLIP